ncbi:hypothetical protein ACFPNZ_08170, partial [Microvirga aerilata]
MSALFEELDYRPTPMGALSLRRRRNLVSGGDIYEIKLGDEFLMSSLFTASEIARAQLGLAALSEPPLMWSSAALALATPHAPCWSMHRWARSWSWTPSRRYCQVGEGSGLWQGLGHDYH